MATININMLQTYVTNLRTRAGLFSEKAEEVSKVTRNFHNMFDDKTFEDGVGLFADLEGVFKSLFDSVKYCEEFSMQLDNVIAGALENISNKSKATSEALAEVRAQVEASVKKQKEATGL